MRYLFQHSCRVLRNYDFPVFSKFSQVKTWLASLFMSQASNVRIESSVIIHNSSLASSLGHISIVVNFLLDIMASYL